MVSYAGLPEGAQALTPYLTVKDGDRMIAFYEKGLGAETICVHRVPDTNLIMHGALKIGGYQFFINDEFPQFEKFAPVTTGKTSSSIHIQVAEGIDELYAQALAAGATGISEPADMFWGDRFAVIADPSGHQWTLGMTIANAPTMSPDEIKQMLT